MPRKNNTYDTTKGSTPSGNRSKHKGSYKPRGKPFPKKGVDSEFDKARAEHNKRISAKGNARRGQMKQYKRKAYWEDQVASYLSKEGNENAGVDILMEIDRLIQNTQSENTRKELIKIKVGMLGLNAGAMKVEEEAVESKKESAEEHLETLKRLGIDVSAISILDDGQIITTDKEGDPDDGGNV